MESNLKDSLESFISTLRDVGETKYQRAWAETQRDNDQYEHDVAIREVALETAMTIVSYQDHHGHQPSTQTVINIATQLESFLRGEVSK